MRRAGALVGGALCLIGAIASARADAPAAPASTVQRLGTTLHEQLAALTLTAPRPVMDVAVCLVAPGPTGPAGAPTPVNPAASGTARLILRLEAVLAAHLAHDAFRSVVRLSGEPACGVTPADAVTLAQERGAELLVHVLAEVRDGRLFLEGSAIRTDRSLWRDLAGAHRGAPGGPALIGQLFTSARLDAELRFYVGMQHPAVAGRAASILFEATDPILGLAVGDLDGDDRDDVVVLHRHRLDVLSLRPGERRAHLSGSLPLDSLQAAATASRDPVGTLALMPAEGAVRRIALRTSDQATGMVVAWDGERFGTPEPLADYPIDAGSGLVCGSVPRGRNTFDPRVVPCSPAPAARADVGAGPFWAVSYARVLQRSGEAVPSVALVLAEARLILTSRGGTQDLGPSGSALWIGDLDDDGVLEVARSAASPIGEPDHLTITTMPQAGAREAWVSRALSGSIAAIAAGDPDGDGAIELIFAELTPSGARVWMVD